VAAGLSATASLGHARRALARAGTLPSLASATLLASHPVAHASAGLCGVGLGTTASPGQPIGTAPLAASLASTLLALHSVAHAGPVLCGVGLGDALLPTLRPALAAPAGPLADVAANVASNAAHVALSASRGRGVAALALVIAARPCQASPEVVMVVAFVVMAAVVVAVLPHERLHEVAQGGINAGDAATHLVFLRNQGHYVVDGLHQTGIEAVALPLADGCGGRGRSAQQQGEAEQPTGRQAGTPKEALAHGRNLLWDGPGGPQDVVGVPRNRA
jgi:hypothetical protein